MYEKIFPSTSDSLRMVYNPGADSRLTQSTRFIIEPTTINRDECLVKGLQTCEKTHRNENLKFNSVESCRLGVYSVLSPFSMQSVLKLNNIDSKPFSQGRLIAQNCLTNKYDFSSRNM